MEGSPSARWAPKSSRPLKDIKVLVKKLPEVCTQGEAPTEEGVKILNVEVVEEKSGAPSDQAPLSWVGGAPVMEPSVLKVAAESSEKNLPECLEIFKMAPVLCSGGSEELGEEAVSSHSIMVGSRDDGEEEGLWHSCS